jgi:predicted ATPase/class 3 adenylate cyclase/Tfp pilus assembly protein PilF
MTTKTLLFTDVVDSTKLVERLGDEAAATLWAEHDRRARALLVVHDGLEIDRTDGFFLIFDRVQHAAAWAAAYHQELVGLGLAARVGLHSAPVTLRPNPPQDVARGAKPLEVEGLAKPYAARIMALAVGGQTLASGAARRELPSGHGAINHGHYRLKGVEEPAEIFELESADASAGPPPDTDKAYRVLRVGDMWQPVREVRHNLAGERDSFIGRADELRQLAQSLERGARLVTVMGPGGTGKTRLVRRYGRAWLGDWPGGVTFCDLSEARSLDGIHFAVGLALAAPLGKGDAGVQLGHAIAARGRCLVMLDNFEQVASHATATVGAWLDRAPEATFVVTSRERLHLPGEEVLAVEPMPLDTDAVALFEVRARSQRPGFVLDAANRAEVLRVVRLLDGLPLAIELAAARVRVLSPAQIVQRLTDRFVLLAGARGVAARQATLRAAIDWSWDLLSPWEQAGLAQCSVFEGGFTLEAVESVLDLGPWPDAPPPIDLIHSLVDKSLLRVWTPRQERRFDIDQPYFGMYISIHEYAADKLARRGEAVLAAAQRRHGGWFARLGLQDAVEALSREGGIRRRLALALEVDNLAVACRRALARGEGGVAAPCFRALWEVLSLQGPFGVALGLGSQALACDDLSSALRIDTTLALANAQMRSGRIDEARELLGPMLALARDAGERRREGSVLSQLAHLDREQGHMARAKAQFEAALAIQRETGHRLDQGVALHNLGNLLDQQGEPQRSRECHEAALALYTDLGHRHGVGHVHASLGILNRHQGRMDEGQAQYEAALAIFREAGDRRSEGITLGNLGNLRVDQGQLERGRTDLLAALAIHRSVGSRMVEPYVLGTLGLVHCQLQQPDAAREHLEQALAIDREVANRYHQSWVLARLGALEIEEGRLEAAQQHLALGLELARAASNRLEEGVLLGLSGELARRRGQLDEALQWLAEGEATLRHVSNPNDLAELLHWRALADIDAANWPRARAALAECEAIAAALGVGEGSALARRVDTLRAALEAVQ